MSYAVVIVNWNGAQDTLACLRSIFGGGNDARAIVIDNGSADGSLAQLRQHWAADPRVTLVDAGQNLGFAAGCNLGLRIAAGAAAADSETVVFLNNDTVVEGDALDRIVRRLARDCFAALPMITVHGTDRIWNCGGAVLPLGLRRYHLAGRSRAQGAALAEIRCSFFTGCCFAVRAAPFMERGGFSERFFFGEEDFELALWMRDRGLSAVCVTGAVIQHKVSASLQAASGPRVEARAFIYYLNRFIHMRLRWGLWRWRLWSAAYLPYVALLLWHRGAVPAAKLPAFLSRLLARAGTMDRVTRNDFEAVMAGRL